MCFFFLFFSFFYFFFQAEDGIRDLVRSRGLGDVYKRQPITVSNIVAACNGPNGSVVLNNSDWPANVSIRNDQGQVVYQYDQVSSELVTGLASGDYTFDQAWTWQITTSCTEGLTGAFTIPDLGPLCGNVHGTSWYDLDADCERDGGCLLYTSDAADERSSVDLGGRRIIKTTITK